MVLDIVGNPLPAQYKLYYFIVGDYGSIHMCANPTPAF